MEKLWAYTITADNIKTKIAGIAETSAWSLPSKISNADKETAVKKSVDAYQNQFNTVLKEYDKLINNCGYQGINLLKESALKLKLIISHFKPVNNEQLTHFL